MIARRRSERGAPLRAGTWIVVALLLPLCGPFSAETHQQEGGQPAFRASVDVVELTVFAVDERGEPVRGLGRDAFSVSLEGGPRRVVRSEFIDAGAVPAVTVPARSTPLWPGEDEQRPPDQTAPDRTIIIALDAGSIGAGTARGVANAAAAFADSLDARTAIGLITYPLGPRLEPTTDRSALTAALADVRGQDDEILPAGTTASDLVDWFADPRQREAILRARCAGGAPACAKLLDYEMAHAATAGEARSRAAHGALLSVLDAMHALPRPKILVLATAGWLTSDRPGGRPDVGDLGDSIGRAAAGADVTVYSIVIDDAAARTDAAAQGPQPLRRPSWARDRAIRRSGLDVMTDIAGGSVLTDAIGTGDAAFDRIRRETGAYYILAVEPADEDRTGRARTITIAVDRPGVTVRARRQVIVPLAADR